MTTPRDAIGLSELIRICNGAEYDARYAARHMTGHPMQRNVEALRETFNLIRDKAAEAATQLDALSARVKELEGQLRTVQNAAKMIAACQGTELEHLRQNKTFDHKLRAEHESLLTRDAMMTEALEAAESRATHLQQELDTLARVMNDTARELGCPSDNEMILEAIARLRQERDEAYERAAKVADGWLARFGNYKPEHIGPQTWANDAVIYIAAAVRRLAAGPEKEKEAARQSAKTQERQ